MKKQSRQARKEELMNLIREKRATFDEAIEDAKFFAAGSPLPDNIQQHVQFVTAAFDSLLFLLKETAADKDLDFIEVRAKELANHRIHVLPIHDLKIEAAEYLEELSSWGVPEDSLALMKKAVAKLDEKEVAEAEKRSIIIQLIENYNFWDDYALAHFGGDGNVVDRDRMETAPKEDFPGCPQDVIAALRPLALPARGCYTHLTVRVAAPRHTSNSPRHDWESLFDYKSVYASMTHLVKTQVARIRLVNIFAKLYTDSGVSTQSYSNSQFASRSGSHAAGYTGVGACSVSAVAPQFST